MSKSETESSKAIDKSSNLTDAVAALRAGDVIVFPTETLYGLGADALNLRAVEKVFQLKGRDSNNPFPVLVADLAMLDRLVTQVPPLAKELMTAFWPGPLTIVLPARSDLPPPLLNRAGGIALRISSQPIAGEIVKLLGKPLTATSANPTGKEPARTLAEAKDYFTGVVNVFVDGGKLSSRHGSTVIDMSENRVSMIREGEIAAAQLEQVLGRGKLKLAPRV